MRLTLNTPLNSHVIYLTYFICIYIYSLSFLKRETGDEILDPTWNVLLFCVLKLAEFYTPGL